MCHIEFRHDPVSAHPCVLLVEDNDLYLHFYTQALRDIADIEVVTARDGFDALVKVTQHRPVIVVTDLDMPGFNGFQMLRILENDPSYLPRHVLVVSGLPDHHIEEQGGLAWHVEYLQKGTLTSELLRDRVNAALKMN
jgi:twitching motility two-component system response regulator PilG